MEVNRLTQEELEYLMFSRGLPKARVAEMRKMWRLSLKRERQGLSFVEGEYPFTYDDDKAAVASKMDEVRKALADCTGAMGKSVYDKLVTQIEWGLYRLEQSKPEEPSEEASRKKLSGELMLLLSAVDTKAKGADEEDSADEEQFHDVLGSRTSTPVVHRKTTPDVISKWGLEFCGDQLGHSLNSFLERIEELRASGGISKADLFRSALFLFKGKALIWFRAKRANVADWDALVVELRAEFLPPDYDDRLTEEIRHRTQGKDESIGVYVAVMEGLFSRLSEGWEMEKKMKLLRRNIHPFYQAQLGLTTVDTIDRLVEVGRTLEATRLSVEAYMPPPSRKSGLLEPDLAYVGESSRERVAVLDSRVKCWNCDRSGHYSDKCDKPRKCFGCGKLGVIKR